MSCTSRDPFHRSKILTFEIEHDRGLDSWPFLAIPIIDREAVLGSFAIPSRLSSTIGEPQQPEPGTLSKYFPREIKGTSPATSLVIHCISSLDWQPDFIKMGTWDVVRKHNGVDCIHFARGSEQPCSNVPGLEGESPKQIALRFAQRLVTDGSESSAATCI